MWDAESATCQVASASLPHADEFVRFSEHVRTCFGSATRAGSITTGCNAGALSFYLLRLQVHTQHAAYITSPSPSHPAPVNEWVLGGLLMCTHTAW